MSDQTLLSQAITMSRASVEQGAFPVGVVIAINGEVIVSAISNGKKLSDPTSHAEIAAIREACHKLESRDLRKAVLYSSMEPCLMCYAACVWASIPKVIYAIAKTKLSPMHFEGTHSLSVINQDTRKPIDLVHMQELEAEALEVVETWEKGQRYRT